MRRFSSNPLADSIGGDRRHPDVFQEFDLATACEHEKERVIVFQTEERIAVVRSSRGGLACLSGAEGANGES